LKKNNAKIDFFEKNWKSFIIDAEIENHPNREKWKIEKLIDLTDKIGDGLHSTPMYTENSDYYFINGNNLNEGSIVVFEKTKTVDQKEYEKHKKDLTDRTVLLSINGTIGNLAFYKNEKVILGKSACYMNCNEELDPEFLYYLLQSKSIQVYIHNELTQTSIPNLSLTSIRKTPIPLPSMKEQKQIVLIIKNTEEKFKEQQSQFSYIKTNYARTINFINNMQSSILNSAFSGKLVN